MMGSTMEVEMPHLPLTFPPADDKGRFISLACANGVDLRYEVRKVMTGEWQLCISVGAAC